MRRVIRSPIAIILSILLLVGVIGHVSARPSGLLSALKPFLLITEVVRQMGINTKNVLFSLTRWGNSTLELRERTVELEAQLAEYQELKRENDVLRDALGRLGREQSVVAGRVISRSPTGVEDYIIVDVGSLQGVSELSVVLARGDIYLGKVSEYTSGTSKVILLSDPGEKTEVFFPGAEITSVAEGQGLGGISIKVPASISLGEGDSIFYAGPQKDFYVGSIERIEQSEEEAFQVIKTKIPFNIYDLRRVFILK